MKITCFDGPCTSRSRNLSQVLGDGSTAPRIGTSTPILRSAPHNLTMLSGHFAARAARVSAPRASVSAVRTYAAPAAASSANTRPPVPLFGLDGTYASALVRVDYLQKEKKSQKRYRIQILTPMRLK